MKSEPSIAARSLRATGLAITLVSLATFSTVVYSAYSDAQAVFAALHAGSAVSASESVQGSTALIHLNVSIQNKGLYPITLAMSCSPGRESGITCNSPNVTVSPGRDQTLRFLITVANYTRFQGNSGGLHLNGTVAVALVPFASIVSKVDFGSFLSQGGA